MTNDRFAMKVLVTGGSGFLGINLIRFLRAKGVEEIRVLDIADFDYPEKSEPWRGSDEVFTGMEKPLPSQKACISLFHFAAVAALSNVVANT